MNIKETNLTFARSLSKRKVTNRLILHHAAAETCDAATIHRWHLDKGWAGIGYHYVVKKDGTIEIGRPEDTVGAHAKGNNSDSIGVCFEGNLQIETMPEVQKQAGKELVAYLRKKYGISTVQSHRDVTATSCPGENFPFEEIANRTMGQAEQPAVPAPAPAPAPAPQTEKEILKVDGHWGPAVTRRLQQIFGTTVDGKVSHQYACYQAQNPGLSASCWEWEQKPERGSQLIVAIQNWLNENRGAGLEANGWIGPLTIKAIQAWMGTVQDGYFSRTSICIRKLQEWMNAQP